MGRKQELKVNVRTICCKDSETSKKGQKKEIYEDKTVQNNGTEVRMTRKKDVKN